MARGLFGSKPKRSMTDPDAFSGGDPSTAEQLSERIHSPRERRVTSPRAYSECPEASEKDSQCQGSQSASPRFDLQTTERSEDPSLTNPQVGAVVDESMIGIALGSPGLVSSHVATPKESNDHGAPALYNTEGTPSPPLRRKSSKWKKIGSLFKGKQPVPRSKSPFYQVQMNDEELQDSTFETRLQSGSILRLDGADVKKGGRREERIQETQSPQEIEPDFLSQHEANDDRDAWPIINSRAEQRSDPSSAEPVPFLHVDIPDIHMERYSVMFGNVLENNQSSNLLARRSRTLDSLAVPGTDLSMSNRPGLPQRRATSPARSSRFTSLPSHPKARKYLDSYTLPRGPSPLSKIKAASVASSPEKLTPSLDASQVSDVDAPLISATSVETRSDADADAAVMLKRRPTKSYVNVKEEPAWEMVTKKEESSSQQQEIPTHPAVQPTPPPTPPRSTTNSPSAIPSLNVSPSKVDRIMSRKGSAPMDSPEEPSPEHFNDSQMRSDPNEAPERPKISVARTISLSRRTRQTVVVESGAARSRSAERLVVHEPRVPDVRKGHRHEKSQLAEIETA